MKRRKGAGADGCTGEARGDARPTDASTEAERLLASGPEPEFVGSYEELGAMFGPHRASFPRFRRDYPDAPRAASNGKHSVAAWRKFFSEHPQLVEKSQRAAASGPDGPGGLSGAPVGAVSPFARRALIEEEQHRKLKIANDQRAGLLVVKAGVAGDLRTLAETQKGILRQKLEIEYPALIGGLSPEQRAELRKKGKELVDDLAKRMQRLVDKWET
jgi:hypothetical protein